MILLQMLFYWFYAFRSKKLKKNINHLKIQHKVIFSHWLPKASFFIACASWVNFGRPFIAYYTKTSADVLAYILDNFISYGSNYWTQYSPPIRDNFIVYGSKFKFFKKILNSAIASSEPLNPQYTPKHRPKNSLPNLNFYTLYFYRI